MDEKTYRALGEVINFIRGTDFENRLSDELSQLVAWRDEFAIEYDE